MSPIALLAAEGVLSEMTTLVHATHVSDADIKMIADAKAIVCLLSLYRAEAGDGMAPIASFLDHKIRLTIGTDSHARVDIVDELRSLEDHERLRTKKRLVWSRDGKSIIQNLLPVAAQHGYACLGNDQGAQDKIFHRSASTPIRLHPSHIAHNWLVGGSGHEVSDVIIDDTLVLTNKQSTRIDESVLNAEINQILKHITRD